MRRPASVLQGARVQARLPGIRRPQHGNSRPGRSGRRWQPVARAPLPARRRGPAESCSI